MILTTQFSSFKPCASRLTPTSYTYDAFGRLVKVEKDGNTVVYGYNPLGQRISRTVTDENESKIESIWNNKEKCNE